MKLSQILRSSCAASALGALALAGPACTSGGGGSSSGGGQSGSTVSVSTSSKGTGEVVAHVGDSVITVDDLKAKLAEQPPMALARMSTLQGKKEFLENQTKFELLSQEAIRQGLDKSPSVQNTIKRILVQELVNQYYQAKIEPTDDDLKAYYEKHKAEYQRPEARRVQEIFVAAPEGTAPGLKEARTKAKVRAEGLLAKAKAADAHAPKSRDPNATLEPLPAFSALARENSADDKTKNNGGETQFETKDSFGVKYTIQFATAVYGLSAENRLSGVIETPRGFYVARLLGIQAPTSKTLDDPTVKNTIKDHVVQDLRREKFEKFYDELKQKTKIDVDEKVLASIEMPPPRAGAGQANPFHPGGLGAPGLPMRPGAPATMGRPPVPPPPPVPRQPVRAQTIHLQPPPAAQPH